VVNALILQRFPFRYNVGILSVFRRCEIPVFAKGRIVKAPNGGRGGAGRVGEMERPIRDRLARAPAGTGFAPTTGRLRL
jgi:hypothetical protein